MTFSSNQITTYKITDKLKNLYKLVETNPREEVDKLFNKVDIKIMDVLKVYTLCFGFFLVYSRVLDKCNDSSSCGGGFCCAFKISNKLGFCMPNKKLGEKCSVTYLKGATFTCGCEFGLTCAIVEKDKKTGNEKFRCVEIPPEVKEHLESTRGNSTLRQIITAEELRKLIILIRKRSKQPHGDV